MPGGNWPFISTHLPQGQDSPLPTTGAWPAEDSWALYGIHLLYHKVSSQADWLMTRPIKTPDVRNNGAFVKESTEGLSHQESVYLPLSLFFFSLEDALCYLLIHDS